MNNEYNILIQQLDKFIRKYYQNQLVRGVLLSLSVYLFTFLTITVLEYYAYFSIPVRTSIFYLGITTYFLIFVKYITIPLLKLNKIGTIITHKQAASIISQHFTHIQDKLLNTLELAAMTNENTVSHELIIASIGQRINEIKPIPFVKAINFKKNFKYFRIVAPLLFILLFIVFSAPYILSESTHRILKHNTYFEPPAPFNFILLNDSLVVEKGSNFDILLSVKGDYVPNNISIYYGGHPFLMNKISTSKFIYSLKNINNSIEFYFVSEPYRSKSYHLTVLPTPVIIDFTISVNVPEYTGETNMVFKNNGDITVPAGSIITWNFSTKDANEINLVFNDSLTISTHSNNSIFSATQKILKSSDYNINICNAHFNKNNFLSYTINVIPDLYPDIKVFIQNDSSLLSLYYFKGFINDDYGLKRLTFNYKLNNDEATKVITPIPITNAPSQEFYHAFDFSSINTSAGTTINYYFEVWDNDAVNGSKSSRTTIFEYKIPSREELAKMQKQTEQNIESNLNKSMNLAQELKNDITKFQQNLLNKNLSNWEKKQMLENITTKQNMLEQMLNNISKDGEQKLQLLKTFEKEQEKLLEKQMQIQKLLDNLMNDEFKKLLEEFNQILNNFDKEKFQKMSEDLKLSYDDLSKQLDRDLQLLKRFQVEQKISQTVTNLDSLAKQQEKLSEKAKEKNVDFEKLMNEQQRQTEEFKRLTEEYKQAQELNKELEQPMQLENFEQQISNIQQQLDEAQENLQNKQGNKASKNQKQSSEKMSELAKQMNKMLEKMNENMLSKSMEELNQIIDDVIKFSFKQEDLLQMASILNQNDPRFTKMLVQQNQLKNDFQVVKDSLYALGKQTPELSTEINKQLLQIERNLDEIKEKLNDRRMADVKTRQQYIMTALNDLALLLSEVLESMQMQSEMQQCNGNCSKPKQGKGKKPSASMLRMQQESLKKQLEQLLEQMKNNQGNNSQDGTSQRIAQMLAQQEMFGKMLNDLINNSTLSPENAKKLNEIRQLSDQIKKDLVNKNITPEMLKRQQQILTRLLEAENSDFQRETEEKRESNEAKNPKISNPNDIFKYKSIENNFNELLYLSNIKLNKFYKNKFKEYMINLNETNHGQ